METIDTAKSNVSPDKAEGVTFPAFEALSRAPPRHSIAVALGGGGARGLAHIVLLEALDELGLKPRAIAGTSMGAIIGAIYASGLSGADIRAHALSMVRKRSQTMARLLKARVGRFADLFANGLVNPVLIDGELFLDLFWPDGVPNRFEDLKIPFAAIATDFVGRREAVLSAGPLAPAVAGSMAIPGLIRPVEAGGLLLIDGGAVNPLPYDHLFGKADCILACDVGGGRDLSRANPKPFEAMLIAAQIMQNSITAEKLKLRAPDILIRPPVEHFRVLDFFKLGQVLRATEVSKDDWKRQIARVFAAR